MILSIQSHVCFGYVGNRAATFPLQRLGYDVTSVNTVQFSNHTGYGEWAGEIHSKEQLVSLIGAIEKRGAFDSSKALLTGYMGSAETGDAILAAYDKLKAHNPNAVYLCDPVMGDRGRGVFVKKEIPEYMIRELIPRANIITPNHFETELICGHEIKTIDDAKKATKKIHAMGPEIVIITSFLDDAKDADLNVLMSLKDKGFYKVKTPHLDFEIAPNGTGDLFSALFLGNFLKGSDAVSALEYSTSSIFATLQKTQELNQRELALIQSQDSFENPVLFKATECQK